MAEGTNENITRPPEPAPLPEQPLAQPKGTITIGKMGYAVGLMWQPLQNPDDPYPEIREAMESDPDANLYCLRSTSTPQYGIGKKAMGHKEGEPSAAAAIASALSDKTSACGVFKVKEGWWFVAIRNDLILSEEDVLFETEEEAEQAFFNMMAVPDWDIKIVPEDWRIDGAVYISAEALVKKSGTKVRLTELGSIRRTQILLIIALVLILGIGGIIYLVVSLWSSVFTEEKIEAMPIPEVIKPVEPIPEKPKPWEKIPQANIFLNKCWNNSYQLDSLTIPGWQIGNISCTFRGLTTTWTKSWQPGGRIGWLKAALNEYKMTRINVQLNADGQSASGQLAFSGIPLVASVPTLTEHQIWEELTDIKQAANLNLNFSKQTVLDPPDNPDGTKPTNQQEYVFYAFSIASQYTPFEWLTFFEKFPGLELTKIDFNPVLDSQDKWKYEGRIYAK